MINPLTVATFAAFFGAGLYVFTTKEEATRLDRELRDIKRHTEQERARTQVHQAEWARLNDQERLRGMVQLHLRELEPTPAAQFVRLEDAARRLPAPVPFQLSDLAGFGPRADAPSRPGETLVVTALSLLAEERGAARVAAASPLPAAAVARPTEGPQPLPPPVALPPVTNPLTGATGREAAAARATPAVAPRPVPVAPHSPAPGATPAPASQALSGATSREAAARPRPPAPPAAELASARREVALPLVAAPPVVIAQAQPVGALPTGSLPAGSLLATRASLPPPVPYAAAR